MRLRKTLRPAAQLLAAAALAALSACGGGAGGSTGSIATGPTEPVVQAQRCSPNNPYRADAESATTLGSMSDEKRWLRDYMDRAYLWYDEVPTVNASLASFSDETKYYDSMDAYFQALKTPAITASGKRKDAFSFIYSTKAWNDLANSGATLGYGIEWHLDSSKAPRGIKVAYVETGSPAALAGVMRGDVLVTADGVAADGTSSSDVATLNDALFPDKTGSHVFVFSRGGVTQASISLPAGNVTKQPVLVAKSVQVGPDKVGYMVFNDHIAPAEAQLINAVNQFKADGISDLVLDLRYNGGGYLYIANELAYMIAGPARASGKVFEALQYNAKRTTDTANSRTLFDSTDCRLNSNGYCTSSQPLPYLNLPRVYVITTGDTCSASEAIINGLRGVDVDVQLIGRNTCGKPYGFTAKDNCGISYFPIEFVGSNAKGFGDYADGFTPTCSASDDFTSPLGDSNEAMLSAALYKRNSGVCKPVAAASRIGGAASEGFLQRPPVRENAIALPGRR